MANRILGYMAAMCWFALAAFTVYGVVIARAGSLGINMAMSAIFIAIGMYLIWRLTIIDRLRREHPSDHTVKALLRVEAVANLVFLVLGAICASAAAFRVFSEAMPVFG